MSSLAVAPDALERFQSRHSGREKPGRYWRIDLETLAPTAEQLEARHTASVRLTGAPARAIVCDLATARRDHAALLERAFGVTKARETKFGALTAAYAELGAFIYLPADAHAAEPIGIRYDVPAGAAAFPYTLVLAERGTHAQVVEHVEAGDGAFVCGVTEVVTGENSAVEYAAFQNACASARIVQTRAAVPGQDARFAWASAELGGSLGVFDLGVEIERTGVQAEIAAVFFPSGTQHADAVSTVDHRAGNSKSETIVKAAAFDRGQARYVGNIRIAAHAQGTNASLRDDALLLSPKAHVDSVPALEIAANDVKAYHGATIGALDAEQIFYMESRGIARSAAERMIALGFFEPAIARFPTQALREEIRAALEGKLP